MKQLVVIGNGMAGIACVEHILQYRHGFEITLFGEETHVNYNRVLLPSVLAGEKTAEEIVLNDIDWYQSSGLSVRLGVRVNDIDPEEGLVFSAEDDATPFDKLILATGSSACIPAIEGVRKKNVHVFHTLDDAQALRAKARRGGRAVVIGGGVLGLEIARALHLRGCEVTVVHLHPSLMERQLDAAASACLARRLQNMGIRLMLGHETEALLGTPRVEGLRLASGEQLEADLVVIAAGVRPNVELGRKAGLTVRQGIVVNDYMETSHPDIFAVGGCTEHRGQLFGLAAPLMEQARVLAATVAGCRGPVFSGFSPVTRLRFPGLDVFSAGVTTDAEGLEPVCYEDQARGIYKKLIIADKKLRGVILVGDASASHIYTAWLRSGAELSANREQLLFPAANSGLDGPVAA